MEGARNWPSASKVLTGDEPNIAAMTYGTLNNKITQASVFDGDWNTTIGTPIWKLQVKLSIPTSNGIIQGKPTQGNETVEFINPGFHNYKLT